MSIERVGSFHFDESRFSSVSQRINREETAGKSFSQILDDVQKENVSRKPKIDKTSKLYEQCEALESFLIKNLLNSMRNTVQKSGLIDEGFAGKMYEDMLYDEYAKDYAKNANFGFAELAYLELTGQRGIKI